MKNAALVVVLSACLAGTAWGNVNRLVKIPLIFERNAGQTDSRVDFLSRGDGYTLFLTRGDAVLRLKDSVVRMRLVGANGTPRSEALDALPGKSNYLFDGGDRTKWRTNIAQHRRVRYSDVYSGIDLVYYGNQKQLEYDFIVAPGADPSRIKLRFDGARRVSTSASGDLIVATASGEPGVPQAGHLSAGR